MFAQSVVMRQPGIVAPLRDNSLCNDMLVCQSVCRRSPGHADFITARSPPPKVNYAAINDRQTDRDGHAGRRRKIGPTSLCVCVSVVLSPYLSLSLLSCAFSSISRRNATQEFTQQKSVAYFFTQPQTSQRSLRILSALRRQIIIIIIIRLLRIKAKIHFTSFPVASP